MWVKNFFPDDDVAGISPFETVEASQEGALARTGRTADHHHFAGGNLFGYIHQGFDLVGNVKRFEYMLDINHFVADLLSRCCTNMESVNVNTR